LCKGSNAALSANPSSIPPQARGMFDVNAYTRVAEVIDGMSNTFAIGEGAGNTPLYVAKLAYTDITPAFWPDPTQGGSPRQIDQGWGAGSVDNGLLVQATQGHVFGCIFGVTAQCGGWTPVCDEPLNGVPDQPNAAQQTYDSLYTGHKLITASI